MNTLFNSQQKCTNYNINFYMLICFVKFKYKTCICFSNFWKKIILFKICFVSKTNLDNRRNLIINSVLQINKLIGSLKNKIEGNISN